MFIGEHEYKVDNKGRLPLPPKFRKEIEDGLVLTMMADNCIIAYTKADWLQMTASQTQTDLLSSDRERRLKRYIFGNAHEVSIDNQGRIALPASLRERCNIADSAKIAGVSTYFEIWNPDWFEKERPTADDARLMMNFLEERK
jgi:MraZ protein